MKVAIDKQELLAALETASKSVATKDTLPIIKGFLLEAEGRTLNVTGNNLETATRYTATCDTVEPGKTVVDAGTFLNIIRKMPDAEELDIIVSGKEMVIEGGKASMRIPVLKPDAFPEMQMVKADNCIELDQQELKEMIMKVAFAADNDKSNEIRSSVLIDIHNGMMNMVALNVAGFAMRSAPVKTANFKTIILAPILVDVAKSMKTGIVKISISHNQIMFEDSKFVITARVLDGEFTDYKRFIDRNHITRLVVNTKEIIASLERVVIVDTGIRKIPTVVKIKNDKMHLTYKSETGSVDDEINAAIDGVDVMSGYNPRVLIELLRNTDEKEVQILFVSKELSAMKILPLEGDKFFYMCGPVRIAKEVA